MRREETGTGEKVYRQVEILLKEMRGECGKAGGLENCYIVSQEGVQISKGGERGHLRQEERGRYRKVYEEGKTRRMEIRSGGYR